MFLLLYVESVIPVPPFSMKPMPPFGVPEVLSQSFWGGIWIVFLLIVPRFFSRTGYWVASAVIGGTALTLVAPLSVEIGAAIFVVAAVLVTEALVRGPRLDQRSVREKWVS